MRLRLARPLTSGRLGALLEARAAELLPAYLPGRRWFGAKARSIHSARLVDWAEPGLPDGLALLGVWEVRYGDGSAERYHLPLAARPRAEAPPGDWLAEVEAPGAGLALFDAFADPAFSRRYLELLVEGRQLDGRRGVFGFHAGRGLGPIAGQPRLVGVEQSNTSVIFGRAAILKAFRRLAGGINPEVEVCSFLTERTGFTNLPRALGHASYQGRDGFQATVAFLQAFVANEGDGWSHFLRGLGPYYAGGVAADLAPDARRLGQVTGQLHLALASDPGHPDFAPQPVEEADLDRWKAGLTASLDQAYAALFARRATLEPHLGPHIGRLVEERERLLGAVQALGSADGGLLKIRIHGDYHLGQVLRAGGDFIVIDFEGEPARPLEERRARQPALKDVAGMLRSFNYAAWAGWFEHAGSDPGLEPRAAAWDGRMRQAYWEGYRAAVGDAPLLPRSEAAQRRLLAFFELDKLVYELSYELNHRPAWLRIPLKGLLALLERS